MPRRRSTVAVRMSPKWRGLGGVQAGRGLVQQDHVERAGQDPGQLHQAALAGGELADPPVPHGVRGR